MQKNYRYLIIGGGSGGLTVAARLRRYVEKQSIAVIEPATQHDYQPLWTLVGAGISDFSASTKSQKSVIPPGVDWINDKVQGIDPKQQQVICANGDCIQYDFLVIATGLELRFDLIPGAEQIGNHGICSIYHRATVARTADMLRTFKGGEAIFTMPPIPIKCAGAPQKIMYLADDIFRDNQVRQATNITFAVAGNAMFSIPTFAKPLTAIAARRGIATLFSHRLIKIEPMQRQAYFEKTVEIRDGNAVHTESCEIVIPYNLLHVVPPMTASKLIHESGLAVETGVQPGWLKVNPSTLQHMDYKNIFGIGDVIGTSNSKTAAAVRKQAPVVVANLLAVSQGLAPTAQYDGYSACPIITGKGKVMLAEFGYDGKLMPSFPFDMTQERRSMWIFKRYIFPQLYWRGMLKGYSWP